ncbi:HK97 gp10 family phage protein [Cytobacillus praedii]|uniref:HK97 gp10 family phage protein n=1 Tax=Cytobacillus praedii TaxID=1742358 RepID=UPI002E1A53AE|nr:HK97 gp10 family phage protein [Cytobacillus praedii]
MARGGRVHVDYRQLQRIQKKIEKLEHADFDKFCQSAAKELAARLLSKVIRLTVTGQYPEGSGKVGGTLRRGWTTKTHQEAESGSGRGGNAVSFAEDLRVTKRGSVYEIQVINPVEYASYVEYGHRTRNGKGWVQGRFMMTISADEVERQAPQILEKKLTKFLKDVLEG